MSLDSLLATLEKDVSPVAAVQPKAGAAFRCNGTDTTDVAAVSTQRRGASLATAATASNNNLRSHTRTPLTCDRKSTAEDWRRRLLDLLDEHPGTRYAVLVDNPDTDPATVALGIRGVGTCELHIPRTKFDPFLLLYLIERHGATVH